MKNFINLRVVVGRMARGTAGGGWETTWPSTSRKPVARERMTTTATGVVHVGCPWNLYAIIININVFLNNNNHIQAYDCIDCRCADRLFATTQMNRIVLCCNYVGFCHFGCISA